MAGYSATDKFLHKFYLSNYSISRASLEIDEILNGAKIRQRIINRYVFVTGLARSGTTAVMNKIFATDQYASLQYSNMPFLLSPNLWKQSSKIESHERAHKDGIIIDGNSPEEFDEYFWKVFLKDAYIRDNGLAINSIEEALLDKYLSYVKLICLAKGKKNYVSKNNNNVLRLGALRKIEGSKLILLFRHPISHAASLMKLDNSFSEDQNKDPFALEYFNYLGHHEFGLNHKPFLLTEDFEKHRTDFSRDTLNYWLAIWLNYYRYVLEHAEQDDCFICFEDLIATPDVVYKKLGQELNLDFEPNKPHKPSEYGAVACDASLLANCMAVYQALSKKTG